MKYLLIVTTSETVITFRKKLIEYLKNKDGEVVIVAQDDERIEEINELGVRFYCAQQNNRGLNPFSMLKYRKTLKDIIKNEKPDVVFTFQIKPNIFGIPVAKKLGIKNIFSMVEGGGEVFIHKSFKWKVIRFIVCLLYKKSFKYSKKIFFLNNDDKKEFIERKLVKESQCEMIHGIGVDVDFFAYKPVKNYDRFLMVSRLLRTKGTLFYCQCARIMKQKYPNVQFDYLGGPDDLTVDDIQEYIDDGSINYLGMDKEVRPYYENCSVLVLPSEREGFPVVVMEAELTGRTVITTNVNGCRESVIDGENGFIFEKNDINGCIEKMTFFIENKEKVVEMGDKARAFAEQVFNADIINERIYNVLLNNYSK